MVNELAARRFLFVLLIGALILVAVAFYPLANALFLGAAFAAVFWRWNLKLAKRLGHRHGRSLAAGIITGGVVLVILGPVVGLSAFLIKEANDGLKFVAKTARSEGTSGLIERLPDPVEKVVRQLIEQFAGEITEDDAKLDKALGAQVAAQGGKAANVLGAAVSATGSLLFMAAMMLIAFFCLLAEGEKLVDWIDSITPLRRGRILELMEAVRQMSSSVIKSTLITSAAQATVALVGYLIARVPYPVFFTALTFFIAFIPAIGAGSVCLAAAAVLLVTGHPYMALFLAIWALSAVGLIDNVIKPFLIKDEVRLHGAIVFFALLGGLAAFGPVGLLIGPIAVALLVEIIRVYRSDFLRAPEVLVTSRPEVEG
ncbi:MAG: AI-2E family transporter [Archangium sp.]|nr:AI-2E family transporter [Archangium sp.]